MLGPEHLVFLIPIIAILGGVSLTGFREWLKFKERQDRLGASTHELEDTVGALREALDTSETQRKRLTERVQNLETIVTSQTWDALHEGPEQRGSDSSSSTLEASNDGERLEESERVRRLARRVET